MGEEGITVLVVDDDPFVREILEFVLQSAGYGVKTAEGGTEALRQCLAPEEGIDVVVSDMNMPGMNGLELTRELRRNGREVPIIVLTGETELKAAAEAVQSGANGYLVKDENVQDAILEALEGVLADHRAGRQ